MSADLREPVEAAAEYQFGVDAARLGTTYALIGRVWDDAKPAVKAAYRESVLGAVTGAASVIEAQVRAQDADEIEAGIRSQRRNTPSTRALWPGMEFAVVMLRGES